MVLQFFFLIAQLCLTLCDPMDCNLPGSSVHGILRARILEWVAMKPSPPPGDLPDPVVKLMSLMYPALAGGFFTTRRHLGSPICWLETQKDENEISFGWVLSWIQYWNFSALTTPAHQVSWGLASICFWDLGKILTSKVWSRWLLDKKGDAVQM